MTFSAPVRVTGFAGSGLNQYERMLKEVYGRVFENHLHKGSTTLEFLRSRKGRLGGRRTVHAIVVGRPQSAHQYTLENSPLPTPTTGKYVNAEVDAKFAFTRLRDNVQVTSLSQGGGRNSFAQSRQQENKLALQTAKINAERDCILGQKSILGTVLSHAVVGSTSLVTLTGRESRTSLAPHAAGGRYFEEGMSLAIVPTGSGAGGAPAAAFVTPANEVRVRSVANKHGTNPTITIERGNEDNAGANADLSGAPWSTAPAAGDFIIPYNSRAGSITPGANSYWSYANPYGLMDLVGADITANIYGLSKASNPTFQGKHSTNGGTARQITELLIATLADATMNEGGGEALNFALMEHSMRRELAALYQSRQQFGAVVSQSGYEETMMMVAGGHRIPTINNWLFPVGKIQLGVREHYGWYSLFEMKPLDEGVARRFVPNKAQSEEVYVSSGNWANMTPVASCVVDDLAASTQSSPSGGA